MIDCKAKGPLCRAATLAALLAVSGAALAQAPIVQPGAPGEASRELSADEAVRIAETGYSPDDVRFMQDMIPHHHQALEMSALAPERTNNPELRDLAGRIKASQADEIAFMQQWLAARDLRVPDPSAHDAMHTTHAMAGMASAEQMDELAAAEGTAFDRLFLQLMIRHHDGAVKMVEELLEQPGAAYDPVLFEFTADVTNDQTVEIERMNRLLVGLSEDPRSILAPGFDDAGQASLNLELVASLPKPPGFSDPDNPAERPMEAATDKADSDAEAADPKEKPIESDDRRTPMRSFANTDMAFSGNVLVAGSYHGFNIYQLDDEGMPSLTASVVCPGGQGDVSIVENLVIMSVEQTGGRLDCGLQGVSEDVSPERFRGLRIFDISDLQRPRQVGAVQTCRGSHTHSVVSGPDENGRIIVYNSGTSTVREEEEMEGCFDELPGDERTALFRVDVIEIPLDDPSKARIVDSPAVFADPETGALAGLWRGGDHGDHTQETTQTDECHDITVFPSRKLAAGACSGNGILFDISDPLNPHRLDAVTDTGFAYWHSATFNNDGSKVIFTDEWGGGNRPRCRAWDPLTWGANAIYEIVEGKLEFRGYFKMPAPQLETENCVAHNGSIVPVPGRDLFVQAWYQGGISVMDFTDASNPVEIAYFDRGPLDAEELLLGGYWSAYWYRGHIYGTEIFRGLDVFELLPSEHLGASEIAAAALADQGRTFNPQQQFPVTWPDHPVVAAAYLEQVNRADAPGAAPGAALEQSIAALVPEGFSGQVVLASPEKVLYSGSFGLADRGAGTPVTDEMLFDIGSITKTFTATAILELVASERLATEDTLGQYFEGLEPPKSEITLHQLLTHSSGLPEYSGPDEEKRTAASFDAWLAETALDFPPGEHYAYSNPGYSALARIVEKVSGQDYEPFLHDHVLAPLGIDGIGYTQLPAGSTEAAGYFGGERAAGIPSSRNWLEDGPGWNLRGNGGLLASAESLMAFGQALARGALLPNEQAAAQIGKQISEGAGDEWYGYGLSISERDFGTVIRHNGGNEAFFATMAWYPGHDRLLTVTQNAFNPDQLRALLPNLREALGVASNRTK